MTPLRPAVFLDRDGTLNVDRDFVTRPEDLQLLPGVGDALRLLKEAGFACVVVSNQSAVGRGMMSETDLKRVNEEMNRQLAEFGVTLDGVYSCTFAPKSTDPLAIEHPDRKPAPGMLLRAAAELGLDISDSWMIGDGARDIIAGQNAGCRGCVMIRNGKPIDDRLFARNAPFILLDDLSSAARYILAQSLP
jgi:D-glycero-D-manno-heptose 1,7-bisphosphate phosphatase